MCIVFSSQDSIVEQVAEILCVSVPVPLPPSSPFLGLAWLTCAWVHTQVPVWAVLDYTETHTIQCKLLIKVSILSLEYLNDQLASRPSHEPCASHCAHTKQSKLNHGLALAHQFEGSKSHITIPSSPSLSSGRTRHSKAAHTKWGVVPDVPVPPVAAHSHEPVWHKDHWCQWA